MYCECSCDADIDYPPTVYTITRPKARIEHCCCECDELIQPGQHYENVKGLWDGQWRVYKTCLPCAGIRDDYCCSYNYGELREVLFDCLDFDYVTGETRCCVWKCQSLIPLDTEICPDCGQIER